ncbi:MAG: ornithine carbamoyltransferase [Syntrophales bacterium]|jgi:ornithine carbamoyltransferase|nr:ornithine carbamoyltransferase [Syntrophales bacterium]MCK9528080.1 ornithine carbamoyltransferase [Syntrophales bacterium]MDX9922324.1 ornithine carbamoyltransferase [Syntrophales bacterium]
MKRDFLTLYGMDRGEFDRIMEQSALLKSRLRAGLSHRPLEGKTLGMIFDKSSTRTRLSFEVGMFQLGGLATFLSRRDIQLGRGESVADTARIMSCYVDAVMIRTFDHEIVEEFARNSTIPVINGLTDLLHPCQIASDLFTIIEIFGSYEDVTVAYVGDGNNIANSWLNVAAILPFRLALACPEGYDPDPSIFKRARRESTRGVELYRSPREAVQGAQVVYTDVWTSMGQESEKKTRAEIFRPFQINKTILRNARRDAVVMHCLPANRGEEITDDVLDGKQSVVTVQAENRLHVQKAILEMLMGGEDH